MNIGHLAIRRPILACVMSLLLVLVGGLAYFSLPVSEYPQVANPTVVVSTRYPGASAATVADTVAAPIEQEINGVEDMLYVYSQATSTGQLTTTVTFKLGTDLDEAQVLVQNRVAIAQPRLPEEVRRIGVTVRKDSPDLLGVVFMTSPDRTYDQLYISNYALRAVRDELLRLDGVGEVQIFGARDYSMRLWLDPNRMAELDLTAAEVLAAVRAQNVQVAGGMVAEPPVSGQAFQPSLAFTGRLTDPRQFERIIVKPGTDGRLVRLMDVARVEVGAFTYSTNASYRRQPAVALAVSQRPGSNALSTMQAVEHRMEELREKFPKGLSYTIGYNPTEFIAESIAELIKTIYEAVILVLLVVIIFLQGWRPAIIPILAIPVSLIGTFAVMAGLGYSINNLTLFGLVLAVGIVVDDAIVVVENVERHLANGMSARDAAFKTMEEVAGALVSIALVLCAVFVPTAFLSGISGQFFRQFAVVIAVATAISCFNSLTLSPALASLILKHKAHDEGTQPAGRNGILGSARYYADAAAARFNSSFDRLSLNYRNLVRRILERRWLGLGIYGLLILAAGALLVTAPTGFIPAQDRAYLIVSVQLPGGASLERTAAVMDKVERIALATPGVDGTPTFAGFNGATRTLASSSGATFVTLKPWSERLPGGHTAEWITNHLREQLAAAIPEAAVFVLPPPAVPGIGTGGGFAMRLLDEDGRGSALLNSATQDLIAAANREPGLTAVFTPYSTDSPQIFVDIDNTRAEMLDVPVEQVTQAIETFFGSSYVNDFNILGRVYRVTAQSDLQFRERADQLANIKVRSNSGAMVPLGSVVRISNAAGAERMPRYNLYPTAEINGDVLPGTSSGQALLRMEALADRLLPSGISYAWTDLSYQQRTSGNAGLLIFPLCVLLVYLVLAAQYGSWTLPFAVILIVPMCLLAATAGVRALGLDVNVLTQIGFVVLVGLAAKNAILIVEFAKEQEEQGVARLDAILEACRLRLRPILMTSFAFILGVVPLILASGAGSEMRIAVGVPVFFGMLGVTAFGLLFTPLFYAVIRDLTDRRGTHAVPPAAEPVPAE